MSNIVCPHCNEEIPKDSKICEYCCGEISVNNIDSNNSIDGEESKFCIHCGKKVIIAAKFCFYCGKNLERDLNIVNTRNNQANKLNQETNYPEKNNLKNNSFNNNPEKNNLKNNNFNNNLDQNREFGKYIIRLQKNLPNPELMDLPSFKEVNFYKINDMFAYVKYIPNISKDIANRFINESIEITAKKSGIGGSFIAPISAHILVSLNISEEIIGFILNSKKTNVGLTKSTILMSAVYDLTNHTLYYKKRTGFIGFLRNSSANGFVAKFNV
ncbi:MAG: zinc ribbon domain-containing protein [Methanobacteriaceae archaeon]|jgi:hypothetical protein|nr:zinc ribbon domain-containing protein [Candidatus Methanorudis spinitermitis]